MTISRVNPPGWGLGDTLTSAQITDIDGNATYALDKRAGQTDTLESIVSCSGAGRVIPTFSLGWDADTTVTAGGGNTVLFVGGTISAERTYTLSATGAQAGDRLTIVNLSAVNVVRVKDQSSADLLRVGLAGDTGSATFLYTGDGIGQGWQIEHPQPATFESQTFNSAGAYSGTLPYGCTRALVVAYGGGGGGGSGRTGGTSDTQSYPGGGGGGGATRVVRLIEVAPGASFSGVVGDGGAGGANSAGSDGQASTFICGAQTLTFPGASGGGWSTSIAASSLVSAGGPSIGGLSARALEDYSTAATGYLLALLRHASHGGPGLYSAGATSAPAFAGNPSMEGYAGGAAGIGGTTNGTAWAGGGGGGGGAGPGGAGAAGGTGGSGGNIGSGSSGTAGTAATSSSGAGGGGGGSGGSCTAGGASTPGNGAAGGKGGSGKVVVVPLR